MIWKRVISNSMNQMKIVKRNFYNSPPNPGREPDPIMYGLLALGLIYIMNKKNPPSF